MPGVTDVGYHKVDQSQLDFAFVQNEFYNLKFKSIKQLKPWERIFLTEKLLNNCVWFIYK